MPTFRGLTVNITAESEGSSGEALKEMGVTSPKTFLKRKTASCYIESVKDMRFGVEIKAQIPFSSPDELPIKTEREITPPPPPPPPARPSTSRPRKESLEEGEIRDGDYGIQEAGDDIKKVPMDETDIYIKEKINVRVKREPKDDGDETDDESVDMNTDNTDSEPEECPYNLLVQIFFDGKARWEIQRYLYLDPSYDKYHEDLGQLKLTYGYVRDRAGKVLKTKWKFQDVGGVGGIGALIDSLDGLQLDDSAPSADVIEEELANALQSANLRDEFEEASKIGQIKIVFKRVVVARQKFYADESKKNFPQKDELPDGDGADSTIVHSTAYEPAKNQKQVVRPSVKYEDYILGEDPFATFVFFYRSGDVLRRFGFLETDGDAKRRVSFPLTSLVGQTKHKRHSSGHAETIKRKK
ncbi:hypothetical protein UCRNP2_3866 [Neofusicoccum parvum UCRNP2]|uniref:DUF7918 domain-containing protein n=1 Tax=Botryosphaeria parva (strain UCR-NP2) TaxID=1287680 RepID=R1GTE6_BOTPV|nr:hypothetical protein UCRNP2_3866 [Neofusicoccum parvum UCRNP2]